MSSNKVLNAALWKELGVENINMAMKLMSEFPQLQSHVITLKERLDNTDDHCQKRQLLRQTGAWMDDNLQDWHDIQQKWLLEIECGKGFKKQYIKDQAAEDNRFMDVFSEADGINYQERLIEVEEDNRVLRQQKDRLIGKIKRMKVQRQEMATKAAQFMKMYERYVDQDE